MSRYFIGMMLLLTTIGARAQYDYSPNGRNDAPVLGMQWGIVGGGFTAMLTNRDDIDADERLNIEMMNFSYGGGIEGVYWFQRNVGFGGQMLYWQGGSKYSGFDSLSGFNLAAKTTMTYAKIPLMFYFKSYNRYYPNRRTRFTAQFGPYVSMLLNYKDDVTLTYKDDPSIKTNYNFSKSKYVTKDLTGTLNGELYNPFELGFVFGIGAELRLWRKTVVALNLRTDVGISDVENKKIMTLDYSNGIRDTNFAYYSRNYAKYNAPNAQDVTAGWEPNRPATKNFSIGAFISIRKYMGDYR